MAYDPQWTRTFDDYRRRLGEQLGSVARRIDHIGSTSVPELAAKPIVDIQLSVDDLADEASYVPGCERVGFELYSRDDVHRFFHVPPPSARVAQLHVCQSGGAFERDHVLFRDFLRTHEEARTNYATTKRAAAQRWNDDRVAYTYAKNDLILNLMDEANEWAAQTDWSVGDDGLTAS